ncbi:unnamed protein product [Bemisia tabaci]|uniref:Uncharacterized protein n=3 Tax=Bemisia tabaci TaxID=7038 RepID=A0A9P0A2T8_BEMTA|nr:unnamed protein product [Bemisia tabaci]
MQNHIFDDRLKNLEEGRLKKGIDDYNVLWRHLNNIKSIFMQWANFSVLGGMTTITMMTFAALTEFLKSDKSGKAITQGVVFLSYVMSAVLVMFTFYYSATLLQESSEDIRFALWNHDWIKTGFRHKKLLKMFLLRLNSPIRMKTFQFRPIHLERFSNFIANSFSYITFLLQLARAK